MLFPYVLTAWSADQVTEEINLRSCETGWHHEAGFIMSPHGQAPAFTCLLSVTTHMTIKHKERFLEMYTAYAMLWVCEERLESRVPT
jgi:hypothetical protein